MYTIELIEKRAPDVPSIKTSVEKLTMDVKTTQLQPLPMVNSPQKLSRKNFDKHKISAAYLRVSVYITQHVTPRHPII